MSQPVEIVLAANDAELALENKGTLRSIVTTMRPHQWVKNLFIFAPLLFGKKLTDPESIGYSVLAFIVFSFLASGLYIFNDWIDAEEDRAHPEKRYRPISSGALSIPAALFSMAFLVTTAFVIAGFIGIEFFSISALYFLLTLSYCLALKKIFIVDAMTISTGFVLRVVGGAIAVNVFASHWLIVCAFLLALFLAFTKRRQELLTLTTSAGNHRAVLNEYSVTYLGQVNNILIGAAIVCYALYTVAPETIDKFGTDKLIYGTIFVIYGMLRYMRLIDDPKNGGNPSKMLLKDKALMLTVFGWGIYNAIVLNHVEITTWFGKAFES
ncbi:MAG TPA: decaprenyl-phosphate phosphoribosyltransferase [Pyrinomonadaceae bacterium]|nr:decaprenyl-phosphate phosphoribosyltransferase [Pyrinomonadaceae bacterium]